MECLIALVVLMGLLLYVTPFLKTLNRVMEHGKKSDYMEVQMGVIQIAYEVRESTFDKLKDNKLYFTKNEEEKIIIEQYNEMVRKTSNKNGHQPIMTGVNKVIFSDLQGMILMEVETLEEEQYDYFLFY